MSINITQQVDYLWKKVGFGLAKTDLADTKLAINESITSSLLLPGAKIWTQSELIPAVIPAVSDEIVTVYTGTTPIKCIPDVTSTEYRTWLASNSSETVLIDWIPPEFGSTYLIRVYLATSDSTDPVNEGIQLFSQGSANNDEWFFDYQAGVLHFVGDNLPVYDFVNKSIYITGARYTGIKGLSNFVVGKFGNLQLKDNTISILNLNGNLVLAPNGTGIISANGAAITNVATPLAASDAVNLEYLNARFATLKANTIVEGNSSVVVYDSPGNVVVTIDDQVHSYYSDQGLYTQNITINGSSIATDNGDLVLASSSTVVGSVVKVSGSTALVVPTGNTNQRPAIGTTGSIRFNTETNLPEYYNGVAWVAMQGAVTAQVITPDGTSNSYVLDRATTVNGVLISINGTLQQPGLSYQINEQTITFAETPLVTDIIAVRFIAAQVVVDQKYDTPTEQKNFGITGVIDTFDAALYRSAKYVASVTDYNNNQYSLVEIYVVHNGGTAYLSSTRTGTISSQDLDFTVEKNANSVTLRATSTSSLNALYLQKTYFPV